MTLPEPKLGRFASVQMDVDEAKLAAEVRAQCERLEELLVHVNDCRPKSVAFTKLEEFAMWANKAIAHYGLQEWDPSV